MKKMIAAFDDNSIRIIIFVLGLLSAQHVFSQQMNISYKTYCNDRFNYCINYPDKLLIPQKEAQNGDGRVFKYKKGKETLVVYGTHNTYFSDELQLSFKQIYERELREYKKQPHIKVTYSQFNESYYIISGIDHGKIFYQKTFIPGDFAYAILTYDTSEKAVYDKVAEVIFQSFK